MPLFLEELNRMANYVVRDTFTFWIHTERPTDENPENGRTTKGGAAYENGRVISTHGIVAIHGMVVLNEDVNFGTADEEVGLVTHWSVIRGSEMVLYQSLPPTVIGEGDTFTIDKGLVLLFGRNDSQQKSWIRSCLDFFRSLFERREIIIR